MSNEPGVQILGVRSKRNRQMSQQDPSEDPDQSWQSHFHPPPPLEASARPPLPPARHPRHGFDFRRPVGTQAQNPIDLTDEPDSPPQRFLPRSPDTRTSHPARLPRFGRSILELPGALPEVIDLDDEPDAPAQPPPRYTEISDRIADGVDLSIFQPGERLWGILPRFDGSWGHLIRRHRQPVQDASVPSSNPPSGYSYNAYGMVPQPNIAGPSRPRIRRFRPDTEPIYLGSSPVETVVLDAGPDDLILDYGSASFEMQQQHTDRAEARRREAYKAPSPPPEGFTRTLGEDDIAICPNCSCELGAGDGKKEEVWVAKPCGHVYCGECADNRSKSKAKKKANAPERSKPFSKCKVADCGKSVSAPTAMFHLYL
ncbi:uncharacterized protein N7503_005214 [Penicillium pulvis]|uniref:uncharacterized protein n=1 Tax=Penicillium pulvis TaxID=1562058 RepID=UPI0025470317|nr:uncharacterized protein N7503_005214 [Penicillium pulvis]KAJ5802764.1 hypothetical protein N7503_005214 [Penicillium pulvis]